VQPAYTFGNAGRNIVEGPGEVDLDMSLMKTIPIGERVATELRWELFNVANHPILSPAERNLQQHNLRSDFINEGRQPRDANCSKNRFLNSEIST